jgi:hypothetical protein
MVVLRVKISSNVLVVFTNGLKKEVNKLTIKITTKNIFSSEEHYQT